MAINKKLIHFKNQQTFEQEVANGNILDSSIVFIQDSKEISTHGTVYKTVNWSVLKTINFTLNATRYNLTVVKTAKEGMTWEQWLNSTYDTLGADGSSVHISTQDGLVYCGSGYNVYLNDVAQVGTDIIQEGAIYTYKGDK